MSGYRTFARHYDSLTGNVGYRQRARYFDSLIRQFEGKAGGLLLDLACGTGSLSVELASLGYEVIGADASAEMLSVAMGKSADAEREILFLHQSMTGLDLYGTVDVTVCALDSLNHLASERELASTFDRVSLFTNPGGLFLFDVNTDYKHSSVLADNVFVYETTDLFCVWQNSYQREDGRVEIALDFFEKREDGGYRRSGECFAERLFSKQVLEAALDKSGFTLLAVYGGDTLEPVGETTERAVYVARKK